MNQNTICLVLCTAPDNATAQRIAQGLIENRLAACVNVFDDVTSVYRWEGKVEQCNESQLLIKTQHEQLDEAAKLVSQLHPYDVPEWVVLDGRASPSYLNWMRSSLT
ncbi:divalent-cation tolerance protein CutA [Alteromonas oceanisediminis]|uniref:divalent-cation tolerance protein CutA n=1 Tax=Alteromonas oceanisediminis TaxID=2836180 RepID=UPI001BDAF24D|nr:divalent-cation tolerance protein CutA [Alteromonas oceanisediminis]MBT0586254.1 divalent-cation tolerance protein CutA [Alteromonas oceanisediminis]